MEVWRDIKGYEGFYMVSNYGRVKSLDRVIFNSGNKGESKESNYKGRILSPSKRNKGYLGVCLTRNCAGKSFLIHRLVAEAFIENPLGYDQINHIDENKQNNNVSNLEWCSNKYNVNYGHWREKQSVAHKNNKRTSKTVLQVNKEGDVVNVYPSISEAKRITGIGHAGAVANGNRSSAGGYGWKFC